MKDAGFREKKIKCKTRANEFSVCRALGGGLKNIVKKSACSRIYY
jgi:hypothetical protein